MRLKSVVSLMLAVSPFLLSACGGSSSSSSQANNEIEITPSLGKISLATVYLYQSDSTTLLSSSEIGSDGLIKISYSGSYSGPIIVVVKGDSDATYFDESTGTDLAFGAGKLLRAIVPAGTTETAVTMLTEIAYQLSLVNSIPLTNTSVNLLNERVRVAMAPELGSIITPPVLFDSNTTAGSLENNDAGKYALRLAALADLGSLDATPALKVAEQMAWDFADGTLDGQGGGSAISGVLYNPTTIATDLTSKLSRFATSYGSNALQTVLANYSAISTSVNVDDLMSSGTGDTLPSYVAGQIVTMKYGSAAVGSPYINDEDVLFSFSSSGSLMLTDQYTVVATSFAVRGSEYIWVDSDNSIEYALSVHNDAIHEVNVTGIGGTPFYGQFTPVEEVTGGEALVPDGDGSALSDGNGVTGTIGLNTYTYTSHPVEDAALYAYFPLTDSSVFSAYANESNPLTFWQIAGLQNSLGTFDCGELGGGMPAVSLHINAAAYLGSECVIEVTAVSSTEIEGRFAAVLTNLGTVTNGYFRYEVPQETGTGGLADGEYGYSMDVDGENVTNSSVPALDGFDRQVASFLTLGDTPTFQMRMIPEGVSGTYNCGEGPNSFRLVSMYYQGFSSDNATYPGSCSISVNYASGIYSGTFSATLRNNAGGTMEITNGVVRNDGSEL